MRVSTYSRGRAKRLSWCLHNVKGACISSGAARERDVDSQEKSELDLFRIASSHITGGRGKSEMGGT